MNELVKIDRTKIKSTIEIKPHVYAWSTSDVPKYDGWLKIGYTEKKTPKARVQEQASQLSISQIIEWAEIARYNNGGTFTDHEFHQYLEHNHRIPRERYPKKTEWFDFRPEGVEKSRNLFAEFKTGEKGETGTTKSMFILRKEQVEAVTMTLNYFKSNPKSEFLWNAKPRFGKTLTTYDLMLKLDAQKILIVTNRPAIANSWYDDFDKFISWQTRYAFVSETDSLNNRPTFSRKDYIHENNKMKEATGEEKPLIEFLSLQDLKGSKYFGGSHDKLRHISNMEWDLLVIDEAHEGVDTFKTDIAFENIQKKLTLHLSGTPFKAIAKGHFTSEQIYNWSYEDEQRSKIKWAGDTEHNPYSQLPTLSLFTYQLSEMITDKINKGADTTDGNGMDYAFDLNEFFETDDKGRFKYERDVNKFLDRLINGEKFPFSTKEKRDEIKHSFWLLNRVASAEALAKLMKDHPVFENFKIILAVGKQEDNQKAYDRVKEAIKKHDKTITLSVGQLTTGVTIPEWTAVMMLSNITSPALYMQSAFRAQNPWQYEKAERIYQKENAYIFDFAPERTLIIFDEFANNLHSGQVNTSNEREANITELLNFFPVIAEDEDGKMVELDATQVLTIPKALKAHEVVRRGFMSNLLFDNISGIFSYPKQLIDILEKLPEAEQGKVKQQAASIEIPVGITVDDGGQVLPEEGIVIATTEAIFGEKHYDKSKEESKTVISGRIEEIMIQEPSKKVAETVAKVAIAETITPVISNIVEHIPVSITKTQETRMIKKAEIAVKEVVEEETARLEIKVAKIEDDFKKQLEVAKDAQDEQTAAKVFEQKTKIVSEARDEYVAAVQKKIEEKVEEQKEEIVREQVKKVEQKKVNTAMEDIRARLRGFARTIPSFIMAYGDRDLKLENFDKYTPAHVFEELTGITTDQFRQLRDGMNITDEDGNEIDVKGLFDVQTFDTSIEEFLNKKEALANYFNPELTEDIFDYIPSQKNNQIFTPKPIVKMMVDQLEKENPNIFKNPNIKFIDLYTKSGLYLAELVKRLHAGLINDFPAEQERLKHILNNQVFGLAPSEIIQKIAQNYVYGFSCNKIEKQNIENQDIVLWIKDGIVKAKEKTKEIFDEMKFDVVIGNPPYQDTSVGESTSAPPIYHLFMDAAYEIADKVVLITPARFLFNAGATPSVWNKKMLNDPHLKITYHEQDSSKVFPNTDIKGGVAVSCRDITQNFGAIKVFTAFEELNSILGKVEDKTTNTLDTLITGRGVYKLTDIALTEHPKIEKIQSKGHKRDVGSGALKILTDIILFKEKPADDREYIQVLGLLNSQRVYYWIDRRYLNSPENLEKYKVILPKANGSGTLGEALSTPLIGEPLIGFTETFISIGAFDNEFEVNATLKYIKSKFARTMLGILKITQDNPRDKWSKVPLQNFTSESDIDWTKAIPEIDQQLYIKYGLDQSEIDFIEEKVRIMK